MTSTLIEHLGHTAFAVVRGEARILIDPIVVRQHLDLRHPTCPRWFYQDLDQFNAIFISHGHDDHLHPPSLLGFRRNTPIYFLEENLDTCSCSEAPRQLLRSLGFENIRPFNVGETIELAEKVRIHIIPAQNSCEGEEQCCFLIETPDVLMLDAVDIKDAPVTRKALSQYCGQIDLAFVPTGASVQWQGFWNQMDQIEALAFCQWLQPAKIASCGGALSLGNIQRLGSLERYPTDWADWLATAGNHVEQEQLLLQRPPFRLMYRSHCLVRCTPITTTSRYLPCDVTFHLQALSTVFFCGYNYRFPTRRLFWPDSTLQDWLGSLQSIREVIYHAYKDLQSLVERCHPTINKTPVGILAPCTLRCLVNGQAFDLAARLSAIVPEIPNDPSDLEISFFSLIEALIGNTFDLPKPLLLDLQTCLWIDRNVFYLWTIHLALQESQNTSTNITNHLLNQHLNDLRKTASLRRPVLSPNHFRLSRKQIHLLTGKPPNQNISELLCYAGVQAVYQTALTEIESVLLNFCDGRTVSEIIQDVANTFHVADEDVSEALFKLIERLTKNSILLIDWSH